jgi:predicted PurR-regulated permease PerM
MPLERNVLFWAATALLFIYLVQLLAPVLLPFVVGMALAYFLNPVVDVLGRLGIPRWISAILLLALSTCLIVIAFVFVVPILLQQGAGLVESAPKEIARLKILIEESARNNLGPRYPQAESMIRSALDATSSALPSLLAGLAQTLWKQGYAAFNFFALLLVTPLVFFYTLLDWPKIVAKLDSWLPRDNADEIRALALEINARVSDFIRGQGIVCIILAFYYATALSIAGLQYGLLVGMLTGFAIFIPVVGWCLGSIVAVVLAVVQFWPEPAPMLVIAGIMLGGLALESGVLSPNIVGSEIGLHPVWLIFALLAFSYLFGFLGLLVAVPVSAAIGVLVRFALRTYLGSSVYKGGGEIKERAPIL